MIDQRCLSWAQEEDAIICLSHFVMFPQIRLTGPASRGVRDRGGKGTWGLWVFLRFFSALLPLQSDIC